MRGNRLTGCDVCTTFAVVNWPIMLDIVATRTFGLVAHWQSLAASTKEKMNFALCPCVPLCFQFPVVLLAFSRSKSDSWCKMHHKQLGGWIIFAETRGQDQLKNCMAWIKNITGEMVAVQAG